MDNRRRMIPPLESENDKAMELGKLIASFSLLEELIMICIEHLDKEYVSSTGAEKFMREKYERKVTKLKVLINSQKQLKNKEEWIELKDNLMLLGKERNEVAHWLHCAGNVLIPPCSKPGFIEANHKNMSLQDLVDLKVKIQIYGFLLQDFTIKNLVVIKTIKGATELDLNKIE